MVKKNPWNKRDDNTRLAVFNLYVEGKSVTEAAETYGVSKKTAHGWKSQKWPESWEKARENRILAKKNVAEQLALESYEQIQMRVQNTHKAVSNALAGQMVRKAKNDLVPDEVAADLYLKTSEAELKIHLPAELQGARQSGNAGVGIRLPDGTQVSALASLEQTFERVRAAKQSGNRQDPE